MPPQPKPSVPLRRIFEMKPPEKEKIWILKEAEKREQKYWDDVIEKVNQKFDNAAVSNRGADTMEVWFLRVLGISPEQREVLVHAEYLKLYVESVLGWEDTIRWGNMEVLREWMRSFQGELGMNLDE